MIDESMIRTVSLDADKTVRLERYVCYASKMSQGGRKNQQDSIFAGINRDHLLAVICDGMGGMNGGEKASALAVQMMAEQFYDEQLENIPNFLRKMAYKLDEAVYRLQENGKRLQAGTTIVAVIMDESRLHWLSVGDSRIYLCRRGEIVCPVKEHNYGTLLKEMLDKGQINEQGYMEEQKKAAALISYLGLGGISRIEINTKPFILESGDQILLCSDGLYRSVTNERIVKVLESENNQEEKVRCLVEEALANGGERQDNTSVILISRI